MRGLAHLARHHETHVLLADLQLEDLLRPALAEKVDEAWLDGVETVGITSGASAPEKLVTRTCDWFRARGVESIEPFSMAEEDVVFRLPVELRRELQLVDS